jgi:hypothetical protein
MDKKIVSQNGECGICNEKFTNYGDIVPDHISPAAWAERGETIIRRTFRLSTGGATGKRDRAGNERRTRVSGINASIQETMPRNESITGRCAFWTTVKP